MIRPFAFSRALIAILPIIVSLRAADLSELHVATIAAPSQPLPARASILQSWADPVNLPLNNVFSVLGAELTLLRAEHANAARADSRRLLAAYRDEKAIFQATKLKLTARGATATEQLAISRHNAQVAEYIAALREISRLHDEFLDVQAANDEARRQMESLLIADPIYQQLTERIAAIKTEISNSLKGLADSHNRFVGLLRDAERIRGAFESGKSPLGEERNRVLAELAKGQDSRAAEIESLKKNLDAQKKENTAWDAAQRKRSLQLIDDATKALNEFNAYLPTFSKAADKLRTATESLNVYLNSGEKLNRGELRKRKEAFAIAQANYDKAKQKLDALKTASETARTSANTFADDWTAEMKRRDSGAEEQRIRLRQIAREHDSAPNSANRAVEKLLARLESETRPLTEQAARLQSDCFTQFGENYQSLLGSANAWLTGEVRATNAINNIVQAGVELGTAPGAQRVSALLAEAADLEKRQDDILAAPRFLEFNISQKQRAADAAAKLLADSQRKAEDLARSLIPELGPASMPDERAFEQSREALQNLANSKAALVLAEFSILTNILHYAMGSGSFDAAQVRTIRDENLKFDAAVRMWLDRNPVPLSAGFSERLESWRNASALDVCRVPISRDDFWIPTGEPPADEAVALDRRKLTPEEWRAWISVWFRHLDQREDGLDFVALRITQALPHASRMMVSEFLNGLMQRAFVPHSTAEVLAAGARQGATLVHMDDMRTYALTRFWSLRSVK